MIISLQNYKFAYTMILDVYDEETILNDDCLASPCICELRQIPGLVHSTTCSVDVSKLDKDNDALTAGKRIGDFYFYEWRQWIEDGTFPLLHLYVPNRAL